jgi:prepilin-type N-terminal cleavage/methylation domain-containing protein
MSARSVRREEGPSIRREGGFTMVELLVAAAVLLIVVAATLQTFVVHNRAYTVIDQVTEAQQNGRAIADLIDREARMTGFMVPEAVAACGLDRTNAPDTVYLTDGDAIDPAGFLLADLGATVTNYASSATTQLLSVDDVVLDGRPFYDTDADGTADSDFVPGGGAILADADNPGRGTACGLVVDVNPGANQVRVDFQNLIGPVAGRVVLVPAHVYQLDNQMRLWRDGVLLAENVEDLQAAYFFDVNGDGQMTNPSVENPGSAGTSYDPRNTDHRSLREIRINVVTRSRDREREFTASTPIFQATENRAPVTVADGFWRRVLRVSARPRNVGSRGA